MPIKTFAAAAFAATIPLYVSPSAATTLLQAQALQTTDIGVTEQVQYRRSHRSRGYYAFGSARGRRAYDRWGYPPQAPGPGSSRRCTGDRAQNSAFPSWMCR
jgi:hypothetical protein